MRWVVMALAAGLAACAAEDAPPETPTVVASRPAARPARPAPRPAPPVDSPWRAASDGITACADQAALRLLREASDGDLRRLASARAAGGCVTVFRASAWRVAERENGMIRLAPAAGGAPLWFWRDEVTEERG